MTLDPDPLVDPAYVEGFHDGWTDREAMPEIRRTYYRGAVLGFLLGFVLALVLNGVAPQ